MSKTFFTFICIAFLSLNSFAQKDIRVTGNVVELNTKQPLEYATIAFFSKKENKMITGGITDEKGKFNIPVPAGIYDVSVEYIGYATKTFPNKNLTKSTNIGTVILTEDTESLDEVEVIAERTTVEIKLDKKVYNVGKDLTVRGGTASDVLDNVPSVSVDVEGNVSLRGQENVRILINGKPSGLVGLNSTDALRQLPAESIQKVEVITSPSARYDSEGTAGILNIILRRSKLQGLNGAITTNVGYNPSAGISGNINYRTGDLNIFNTTGYRYREVPGNSETKTHYFNTKFDDAGNLIEDNPDTYLNESREFDRIRKGFNTNLGLEWYINDSASFTTSVFYRDSDNESNTTNRLYQFNNNRLLTSESVRFDPEIEEDKTIQYSANFTKNFETSGHKLTFDFQYEDSTEDENSLVAVNGLTSEKVGTLEEQTRILLQGDYVLPIGENAQFELGYRGNFNNLTTDYTVALLDEDSNQFILDTNLSNLLNYKEYVNAAYYQHATDVFNFVSFDTGETVEVNGEDVPVVQRTPINLSSEDRYGFEFTLRYRASRKFNTSANFNVFRSKSEGVNPNGVDLGNENTSWFARVSSKYTLPADIEWQTSMFYRGPSQDAQNKRSGIFSTNIAFSKDLFKDKASIAFNVSDLFNSRKRTMDTTTDTYTSTSEFQWRERSFNLSFTYRFNQKKKRQGGRNGGDDMDFEG